MTLQALQQYFAKKSDERSRFRARVLQEVITKYESTGIQKIDENMTRFRAMYADECAKSLSSQWVFQKPRKAWWDDNWFVFRHCDWPKGVKLIHQAKSGLMNLVLPIEKADILRSIPEEILAEYPNGVVSPIKVVAVNKRKNPSKSAFQIAVQKVTNFATAQPPDFQVYFSAIDYLAGFYKRVSNLLPEALRVCDAQTESSSGEDTILLALRAMLLGFMRSTTMSMGTDMPYPLPDIRKLTAATPGEKRYFASPGLMGGFVLELHDDKEDGPYVLSDLSSRQWEGNSMRHKIRVSEVLKLDDEVVPFMQLL